MAVAEAAGQLCAAWPGNAGRRALVQGHLRRLYGSSLDPPTARRLTRQVFASYARYWAESLRLPSLPEATVRAGLRLEGGVWLEQARRSGRGAIVALPHLGGWEWAGRALALDGHRVAVVVERLSRPDAFEWFVQFRCRLGFEVIPADGRAGWAVLRALQANHLVCLLADRLVGRTAGVPVSFFGEVTELPAGPVLLSLRSGAPLLPAAVYFGRRADEHLAVVGPPLAVTRTARLASDVAAGTERLATALEDLIARAPTQWHLMQPNWPSDR